MRGKGVVERAFSSINTLFCQHVAGYVGSNVTRRGHEVQAVWTIRELADLFEEWLIACWQRRPHDGLRSPFLPGRALSPNEACALLVARTGYLPVCLTGKRPLAAGRPRQRRHRRIRHRRSRGGPAGPGSPFGVFDAFTDGSR
jgi:hypothetical protein